MRRKLTILLTLSIAAVMFISCGATGSNSSGIEQESVDNVDNEAPASDESVNTVQAEDLTNEAVDDEFYYIYLKNDEEQTVDLGQDGQMDTLCSYELDDEYSEEPYLRVNDNTYSLTKERGELYADVCFVHKADGDYIISDTKGDSYIGNVRIYKWNTSTNAFVEIDEITDRTIAGSINDEGKKDFKIESNKIYLEGWINVLGSKVIEKAYSYGTSGFAAAEEKYKFYGIGTEERKMPSLVLKQSLTLLDDNGNEAVTLEPGEKVYLYEGNDPADPLEGLKTEGNYINFASEDGKVLGHVEYELRKDDEGPFYENRQGYTPYINGIKEDDLFDGIIYAG